MLNYWSCRKETILSDYFVKDSEYQINLAIPIKMRSFKSLGPIEYYLNMQNIQIYILIFDNERV